MGIGSATSVLSYRLFGEDVTASKSLEKVGKTAKDTGRDIHTGISGGAATAAVAVGSLAANAITSLVGIASSALKTGLETAGAMEQAQTGFTSLIGSAKGAQDYLSQLSDFAAATPFEMKGLIDSSRTLLGVGVSAKDVIPMLTDFGDAAGAVGIQGDAFNRIMMATSQAISAGKFQAGDLNQIMNNGLPVWSILSKSMHKPVSELRDMASKGKLLAKDVMPALQSQMHKDYGGSMAKQSMTLNGIWSTLQDTFTQGMAKVLVPMLPMLKDLATKGINALSTAFAWLAQNGPGVAEAIKNVAVWLGDHLGPIIKTVAAWVMGTLIPAMQGLAGWVMGTMVPAIQDLAAGFMENVWPALQKVGAMIADNLQPAIEALSQYWTTTLLPGLTAAWPVLGKIAAIIGVVIGVIAVVVSWILGKLVPAFLWVASKVAPIIIGAVGLIANVIIGVGKAAATAWTWVSDNFTKVIDFVKGLPGKIASAASGMWDGIKDAFRGAINWIIDHWNGIHFRTPDIPGTDFGGQDIRVPQMPRLALGGIVTRPTIALIGEAGPEAVVPLGRSAGFGMGGGGTHYHLNLNGTVVLGGNKAAAGRDLLSTIEYAISSGQARPNVLKRA